MIELGIGFNLINTQAEIQQMVCEALRDEFNRVIPTLIDRIKGEIKQNTLPFFLKSKGYNALVNGPLDAHFGIPKGEAPQRLREIIDVVINNLDVSFDKISYAGSSFTGGITTGVIVKDYMDVLHLPAAIILTEKGQVLPWVEWLTLRGSQIIVSDYLIKFGNFSDSKYHSRSEKALMLPISGTFWRVPTEYAGTGQDNWLTRAITDLGDAWSDMISQILEKHLN